MVLNLKSLIYIMVINLVYGFAVPGIDNAGHIGGAITGLIIALALAIAYRQRMAAVIQNTAINRIDYLPRYQSEQQNEYHTTLSETLNEKSTPIKLTLIWQLLPWIVMLCISIGFMWWWQDIHQQLIEVLNAIEQSTI
jgi:hypothetical protein